MGKNIYDIDGNRKELIKKGDTFDEIRRKFEFQTRRQKD